MAMSTIAAMITGMVTATVPARLRQKGLHVATDAAEEATVIDEITENTQYKFYLVTRYHLRRFIRRGIIFYNSRKFAERTVFVS